MVSYFVQCRTRQRIANTAFNRFEHGKIQILSSDEFDFLAQRAAHYNLSAPARCAQEMLLSNVTMLDTAALTGLQNATCSMFTGSRTASAPILLSIGMLSLLAAPSAKRALRDIRFFTLGPPEFARKVLAGQSRLESGCKTLRVLSYGSVTFVSRCAEPSVTQLLGRNRFAGVTVGYVLPLRRRLCRKPARVVRYLTNFHRLLQSCCN